MNVVRDLLRWRLLVAVLLPSVLAFAICDFFDNSPLAMVLVLSFVFMVVPSFTRYMARAQGRTDMRAEIERLQQAHLSFLEMLEFLPPEDRKPYTERLKDMELRLKACTQLLEEYKK